MNPLPKGWATAHLGDVVEVVRGASPRPKGDPRYFGGPIPWISIGDLGREPARMLSKTVEGLTTAGAQKSRLLPAGTLILSNSATVGLPKILAVDGCIHDGFVAFPNLDRRLFVTEFLYEFFRHIRTRLLDANRRGMTQINLNTAIVRNIEVVIPPLAEQRRIVARLDTLLAHGGAAKASLERVHERLGQLRQSLLAAAFRGDLTADWRARREPDSVWNAASAAVLELPGSRSPQLDKPADDGVEQARWPHRRLPSGWCWVPFELVFSDETSGDKKLKQEDYLEHGAFPVIDQGAAEVGGYSDDSTLVYDGELPVVLFGDHTRCVKLLSRPFIQGAEGVKVLRPSPLVEPGYASFLLRAISIPERSYGRHFKFLKPAWFPLAPRAEQLELVSRLQAAQARENELAARAGRQLDNLALLERSILARAFRGELVPQDPNDPPVSALLERLRAERST
ncbi:type I restriction enzyme S subunit [Archangium gephyra]|uniref:Type I restriction enzyme S subunit n=1 Tax=Archangium gephyra TaxID=48 RepID=A0AAC8QF53_9BACT|nr:restriction endonuclease subunit S [Archangium gephyra]AKJ06622.1 Type I restriction-modification system, specificity subunit S [Archangium gephyra]REG32069.1 type I restriction enzyme S subunit [Archangium gephyra]